MIRARQSRLSKVEEATAPVSRKIIVWDDHKGPEDTAKKIAALRESGRASEHDQFIVVGEEPHINS